MVTSERLISCSYWTSTYKPDEYNFVQYALDAGYSVLYYDRLGTGKSELLGLPYLQCESTADTGQRLWIRGTRAEST